MLRGDLTLLAGGCLGWLWTRLRVAWRAGWVPRGQGLKGLTKGAMGKEKAQGVVAPGLGVMILVFVKEVVASAVFFVGDDGGQVDVFY